MSPWDEQPIAHVHLPIGPEEVFFDIGAADANWTIYAAHRGAVVYAFEPSLPQYKILVENVLRTGGFSQCRLFNIGLDKSDCVRTLQDWYESFGGPGFEVSPDCRVRTRFLPMDHFLPELTRLDWIKIDVEGGEFDVMRGGVRTIDKFRPSFIIENHINMPRIGEAMREAQTLEHMASFFSSRRYRVFESTCQGTSSRSFIIAHPQEKT